MPSAEGAAIAWRCTTFMRASLRSSGHYKHWNSTSIALSRVGRDQGLGCVCRIQARYAQGTYESGLEAAGFVADAATEKFYKLIPNNVSRDDVRQAAALISKMFTSKGVTSACDADAAPNAVQGYQDPRDAGELCSALTASYMSKIYRASWMPGSIPVLATIGCALAE